MSITGLSPYSSARLIRGKVTGIYADRRGVVVQFDKPISDGDRQKRSLGYAKRGTAGLSEIISQLRRGTAVVVRAEFSNAGLATITSIKIAG